MHPSKAGTWAAPFRPRDAGETVEFTRLLAEGLLRMVVADCVVAVDVPDSRSLRALAAGLVVPARLVASGAMVGYAGALWLLAGTAPAHAPPPLLDVLVPRGANLAGGAGLRLHQVSVPPEDVVRVEDVPVTSPARTAADVARAGGLDTVEALCRLRSATGVTPREVLGQLARMHRQRGVARARQAVRTWAQ